MYGYCSDHCKCDAQKKKVITVKSKRTRPKAPENRGKTRFICYTSENTTGQECGKEDKPFSLGDKPELLVGDDLGLRRQMC